MKTISLLTTAIVVTLCQSVFAAPPDKATDSSSRFHASCTAEANGSSVLGTCTVLNLLDGEPAVIDSVAANCHQFGNSDASDYAPVFLVELRFPGAGSDDIAAVSIPLSTKGGKIGGTNYDIWYSGVLNGPWYVEGTPYGSSQIGLYFVRQYGTLTKSNVTCTLEVSGRLQ